MRLQFGGRGCFTGFPTGFVEHRHYNPGAIMSMVEH